MLTQFCSGFGISQSTFVGYIKDGVIYSTDASGQQVIVGVASKTHDDLKADYDGVYARCQEYYDRLVKLGEITPELTGEALIKAQADELAKATQLISKMSQKQDQLLTLINKLTLNEKSEEASNEYSAVYSKSDTGSVAAVEGNDFGSRQGSQSVSKLPAGSASGHSRKKSKS